MLAAEELTLWRGMHCLFEALSFSVAPGEALLVEGANGAGKTTLLRVIGGFGSPESGTVTWDRRAVPGLLRSGELRIAYLGHVPALKSDLSVEDNLRFYARLGGRSSHDVREAIARVQLDAAAGLPVRVLSAGQKRRAGLARVLLAAAGLWLLDEPLANLDEAGRRLVEWLVTEHLRSGGTAVVATHRELELGPHRCQSVCLGASA